VVVVVAGSVVVVVAASVVDVDVEVLVLASVVDALVGAELLDPLQALANAAPPASVTNWRRESLMRGTVPRGSANGQVTLGHVQRCGAGARRAAPSPSQLAVGPATAPRSCVGDPSTFNGCDTTW
jgi:hypothetical protein